jgi:MFS transporter, FHS family, L-fucose permease
MVQVAIHPILRTAGGEENFAFYSVLSGLFFGLASFLSPLVYSYLVLNLPDPESGNVLLAVLSEVVPPELPWTSLYWIFAAVSLLMVVVVAATPFPAPVLGDEDRVGTWRTHLDLIRQPLVVLYFLGIVSYVGIEVGVANWTSEFLASYHGYDPQTAGAQAVSLFWGLMTAGTLVGLLALKLFDSRRVLVVFTLAAVVSFSIGIFGPGPLARYALPAVGFFASVMWPIIFDLALNSVDRHHGSFSGILVTGIIGGAVVPLAIGWTGDLTSLRTGMSILYVLFGYILSIGFWADPIIRNKTFSFIEGRT